MRYIEGKYPKPRWRSSAKWRASASLRRAATANVRPRELPHLRKRMEQLVRGAPEGGTLPRSKRSIAASNRRR